jgi:hypothetical protein
MPTGIPHDETQMISTALSILGYPIIQSIQAGGPAAAALDNLYDVLMAADLSSPNWRFATKVAYLSQIAGVNPNFKYFNVAYQIPPDCCAIWEVWPPQPYEVFGDQIWTIGTANPSLPPPPSHFIPPSGPGPNLQIQYRAVCSPALLPPAYVFYFCYLLASTAAPGITDDPKVLEKIEAGLTKWRAQAMIVNTQGRPNKGLTNSGWVNARPAGNYYGTTAGVNSA